MPIVKCVGLTPCSPHPPSYSSHAAIARYVDWAILCYRAFCVTCSLSLKVRQKQHDSMRMAGLTSDMAGTNSWISILFDNLADVERDVSTPRVDHPMESMGWFLPSDGPGKAAKTCTVGVGIRGMETLDDALWDDMAGDAESEARSGDCLRRFRRTMR